jgi:hypothetical protein
MNTGGKEESSAAAATPRTSTGGELKEETRYRLKYRSKQEEQRRSEVRKE